MSKENGNLGAGAGGLGLGPGGKCVCPKCGTKVDHETGKTCLDQKCPKCGASMSREVKKGFWGGLPL